MEIYFFTEPYDKGKIGSSLENIGFRKVKFPRNYELGNDLFIVNFTDCNEGRYQIQGDGLDDIQEKGK